MSARARWRRLGALGARLFATLLGAVLISDCRTEHVFRRMDLSFDRMLIQPRYDPYASSDLFADGATMRTPPAGTLRYRAVPADPVLTTGLCGSAPVTALPVALTRTLLERGRDRFGTFCAPCHGVLGDGDTMVATHMRRPPPSLHEPRIVALADGTIFRVISEGYGFMPPYRIQLSVSDRWAVVAYVRALEQSQHAPVSELPPAIAAELRKQAP